MRYVWLEVYYYLYLNVKILNFAGKVGIVVNYFGYFLEFEVFDGDLGWD